MVTAEPMLPISAGTTSTLPPEVAENPWVLYVVVGLAILGIITTFIRRESDNWGKWLSGLRRAKEDRDDILVRGLRKDLEMMQERIELSDRSRSEDYARLSGRIEETNRRMQQYRTERDALVTYLREWWNWAIAGSEGTPPPVPSWLRHLLPEESWTWRPEYLRRTQSTQMMEEVVERIPEED